MHGYTVCIQHACTHSLFLTPLSTGNTAHSTVNPELRIPTEWNCNFS